MPPTYIYFRCASIVIARPIAGDATPPRRTSRTMRAITTHRFVTLPR